MKLSRSIMDAGSIPATSTNSGVTGFDMVTKQSGQFVIGVTLKSQKTITANDSFYTPVAIAA